MKHAPPLVISLGGSVIVPGDVNVRFLRVFVRFLRRLARRRQVIVITGGGSTARRYIARARDAGARLDRDLHWIGIRTTQLNAELLRAVLGLKEPVVTELRQVQKRRSGIVVAAGARPGVTTDVGAITFANVVDAPMVVNITNVDGVYTADPRRERSARLLRRLSWREYRRMFNMKMRPGIHVPFDPIAARLAERSGIRVVILSSNLKNLERALAGGHFRGTVIGA